MSRDRGALMEPQIQHFRIQYKKGEALRYTANLDVHRIWERYFRRAQVPLAYSKGYHPHPRINQAMPLPLGMLSDYELLDFWTESETIVERKFLKQKLMGTRQPGIQIDTVEEIHHKQKSLQSQVTSVKYDAKQFYTDSELQQIISVDALLAQESILRIRRKKEYNLRPMIIALTSEKNKSGNMYFMHLTATPGLVGRPDEVLAALGENPNHYRITRTNIILAEREDT